MTICGYSLWSMWPILVVESIQWQRKVNAQLADLLYDAKSNPLIAGGSLAGFSFIYGMLHSLGPGHGKVIVTTYLATHPTKVKASLMLTVISAFIQALVAIVLVSVLVWGFQASMRVVNEKAAVFVSLSFALVVVLGGLISWKAIQQIYHALRHAHRHASSLPPMSSAFPMMRSAAPQAFALKSAIHRPAIRPSVHIQTAHNHDHHADCGCGHSHVADAEAINRASTWREYAGIVASIGIRPCTGAVMVLLFANLAGLYWMGVVSAIVMAAGTALTTSLIAVMTLTGKQLIQRYLITENSHKKGGWQFAGYSLKLLGGILMMVIGMLLMGGQDTGLSPMFSV
nr:nickel/cobalt transporter [Photobacterium sp. GJ3]